MAKPKMMGARVGWIETLVQISLFIDKLLDKDPSTLRTVCISKPWSFSNYYKIFTFFQ